MLQVQEVIDNNCVKIHKIHKCSSLRWSHPPSPHHIQAQQCPQVLCPLSWVLQWVERWWFLVGWHLRTRTQASCCF